MYVRELWGSPWIGRVSGTLWACPGRGQGCRRGNRSEPCVCICVCFPFYMGATLLIAVLGEVRDMEFGSATAPLGAGLPSPWLSGAS